MDVDLVLQVNRTAHYLRGRVAKVAYLLAIEPDRCRNAEELGLYLDPPPPSRKAASTAAHQAIGKLRQQIPGLLYKGAYGRGWRIASEVKVKVLSASPRTLRGQTAVIGIRPPQPKQAQTA